ncbi:hypothetical protein AB82_4366 [Escherichia coli 2-005-03_S3_C1]|nr:hypothetical protein AB82_4366 [Escherichia coli 2-005-03_S3_C1]KDW64135.1 hypothetical protein AC40_4509 [Escherichia coli 2-005-03_S3_C3]
MIEINIFNCGLGVQIIACHLKTSFLAISSIEHVMESVI